MGQAEAGDYKYLLIRARKGYKTLQGQVSPSFT